MKVMNMLEYIFYLLGSGTTLCVIDSVISKVYISVCQSNYNNRYNRR